MKRILKEILVMLCKKITLRKILIVVNCVVLVAALRICVSKAYDYYSNRKVYKDILTIYSVNKEIKEKVEDEDLLPKRFNNQNTMLEESHETKISDKFQDLLKINKDTVGWISIKGTHINYPVVKYSDNDFYLNRNFEKKKSSTGCIFMDYRNNILPIDKNILLYGHHMKDLTMFRDLILYENKDFFYNNDKIIFNTLYGESEWQVFSVYTTGISFDYLVPQFSNEKEYSKYLDSIKAKSKYKKDITVSTDDNILTLSTCSYAFTEARTVVHAKLIK